MGWGVGGKWVVDLSHEEFFRGQELVQRGREERRGLLPVVLMVVVVGMVVVVVVMVSIEKRYDYVQGSHSRSRYH